MGDMSEVERRANPNDKNRDRRFVPRFAHPTIRESIQQIRFWALSGFWVLIIVIIARLIQGLVVSADLLARATAEGVGAALFATTLFAYARSLKSYSERETPATLADCFEKQRNVWMTAATLIIIACISYFVMSI